MTSSASTTGFLAYDALGRVTQSRQTTGAVNYDMYYGYDLTGNLASETYPSGRVVATSYDVAGRTSRVSEGSAFYAEQIAYASHGAVASLRLGNGLWESATFNSRLQPTLMGLGGSPSNRGALQLNYGTYGGTANNGNVLTQTISIGPVAFGQVYTYDGLNRLATATETRSGVQAWTQTYGYDRWGNRAVTAGAVLNASLTPTSLGNFSTATNRLTMGTVLYDAAGNLTRDSATPTPMTFVYDGENRQTSAGTTTYTYDGDGRRVKKVVGGTTNTYVYDAMGRLVAEYLPTQPPGPIYLTPDHLGSTRVATDQSTGIVERHDYLPYGEEIPVSASAYGNRAGIPGYGTDTVRQKFTGKERDSETGLDYFNARYHSGAQGRFSGADEPLVGQSEGEPQSWQLYSYTGNNPLNRVDPNGRDWFIPPNGGEPPVWIPCDSKGNCALPTPAGWRRWMPSRPGEKKHLDFMDGTFELGVDEQGNPTSSYETQGVEDATLSDAWAAYSTISGIMAWGKVAVSVTGAKIAAGSAGPKLLGTARDNLLSSARNPRLRKLINYIYRKGAKVGSGSTADAVRHELSTGRPISRVGHSQEAGEAIGTLEKLINGDFGKLDQPDAAIARQLLEDLKSAVGR